MCYNNSVICTHCRRWVNPSIQQAVSLLKPWQGKKKEKETHHGLLALISFGLLLLDWQLQFCTTQQGNSIMCQSAPLIELPRSQNRKKLDKILKCIKPSWDFAMNIFISLELQLPLGIPRSFLLPYWWGVGNRFQHCESLQFKTSPFEDHIQIRINKNSAFLHHDMGWFNFQY